MRLCSNDHEEICYSQVIPCPLCKALEDIKDLEDRIDGLEEEVNNLYEDR